MICHRDRPGKSSPIFCGILATGSSSTGKRNTRWNFDLNPATSLNLTYQKYGDGKERGPALAQLHQVYQGAGYEAATCELPDFLPLVLEFLAICPSEAYTWLLEEYRSQIETLANRLKETGTPYANLFSVIGDTFRINPA